LKIRKFCACGIKLERDVSDEETAREVVTMFWTAHAGVNHGPISEKQYHLVIGRIIKRRAKRKEPSEIEEFTMEGVKTASDLVQ
jgi:hypothetical protein